MYIAQGGLDYSLCILSREDVQKDRCIEQSCPSNDEVVEVATGQLHDPEQCQQTSNELKCSYNNNSFYCYILTSYS